MVDVTVEGTITIAKETCLARLQTRPATPYTNSVVSEDIRRLYALGYFTDVRVESQPLEGGVRVVFRVKEKPAVTAIEVDGHQFFRKEKLLQIMELSPGKLYDPRTAKDGVDKLKAEYLRQGYAKAEIATTVQVNEATNQATLYVAVDEGPRMRITKILVEGNLAFSDNKIRSLLKTKRRFLFSSGVFNAQTLDEDLERVRVFYRQQGYEDIQATSEVLTAPRGDALYVYLKLQEGLQHRVGEIAIAGTVLFPERELRTVLRLKPGSVFNPDGLQGDLRAIKQYYGDRGYINADVAPETQLDPSTKRVNLTYRITENELVYVNRIEIRGNLHTKDVVVRRELRIWPGQAFNGQQIRHSIERLNNLGFFEEVNVDTEPTTTHDHEDLIVDVKEAKTGSFSFGGGFSSVDRLVGMVEVEQRNFDWQNAPSFTGAGEDLRFRTEIGTVRRYFDLAFTEPWMLGYPVSFGIDGFYRTQLRSRSLGLAYQDKRRGAGLRLGKELTETLRLDGSYQFFRTTISDVVDEASADLKAEQGTNDISVVGLGLGWDTRDNRFEPTKGAYLFGSGDLAGGLFQGSRDFYRLQAGGSYYWPHLDRFVLESRIRAGIVNQYGNSEQVPIFERFFAGGSNTIRGYRERRVGPLDANTNDPIGGEATALGTLEEVMTIVRDERSKPILKGALFIDTGDVWRSTSDFGSSLKTGVGVGVRVTTPVGPLRLDLGFPMNDVTNEKRKPRFHFNLSPSF